MSAQIRKKTIDKTFLLITVLLIAIGIVTFVSASLSVLATNEALFFKNLFNQMILGLLFGGIAMYLFSRIKYSFWQKWGVVIFVISVLISLAVFVPGLAIEHGGAKRWIDLGIISFQPAEILKFGFILFLAKIFSETKRKVSTFMEGFVPFILITGIVGLLLLAQPDTGTFLVIVVTGLIMYFVAGARWRDLLMTAVLGLIGIIMLIGARPYLLDRIKTFSDPNRDLLGSSWQIRQSQIAIGSGKIFGRGIGQSVQKFQYLPEQTGDSVFAIYAEETGFIGTFIFLALLVLFFLRGFRIARLAPDMFSRLLALGIVILMTVQSFVNISAIVGIIPLTGLPLVFMSHGGTALFMALAEIGIVLNISKFKSRFKKKLV